MKRSIIVSAFLFTAFVAMTFTPARLYAMRVYGAPCGQASGFAGFLQQTHFLPSGTCVVGTKGDPAYPCASSEPTACTTKKPVSGHLSTGTCQPQGNTCVC